MVLSRIIIPLPSPECSWIIAFLPQIILWFPSWSCSLRSLLCHHSGRLLQINWTNDSKSLSLCIKLCYWRLKSPLCLPINLLLVILELVLGPSIGSSSDSLSWPQGTEFVDSYLKFSSFCNLSMFLSHDNLEFCRFIGDVPLNTLRRLTELDYRKALVEDRMHLEFFGSDPCLVLGIPGIVKALSHTIFECIRADEFDDLVLAEFLSVRFRYDYQQWLDSHITRWSINSKREESSGDIIPSLARAVLPLLFTLSPVKIQLGRTVDCINSGMGKSWLYGIGNLIWRSGITINLGLLTTGRQ